MEAYLKSEPCVSPQKEITSTEISKPKVPLKSGKRKCSNEQDIKVDRSDASFITVKPVSTLKSSGVTKNYKSGDYLKSKLLLMGLKKYLTVKKKNKGKADKTLNRVQSVEQPMTPKPNGVSSEHRTSRLVPIGMKKYITIRRYCGQPQINIRDYSRDSCGKMYSTKRGIMLTPEEWTQLKESFKAVDTFLQERQLKEKTLA